jgi:hypothetical protein
MRTHEVFCRATLQSCPRQGCIRIVIVFGIFGVSPSMEYASSFPLQIFAATTVRDPKARHFVGQEGPSLFLPLLIFHKKGQPL